MDGRSEVLARRFERAIGELIAAVEACSDADWQATGSDGAWSVAATAHHIVAAFPIETRLIGAVAAGTPPPALTWELVDGANARHALEYAQCTKAEVLDLLHRDAPRMAELVRGLSNEQLDRAAIVPLFGAAPITTHELIEGGALIGHIEEHLRSLRAAR